MKLIHYLNRSFDSTRKLPDELLDGEARMRDFDIRERTDAGIARSRNS
ncbi:MAG: hypothetical protein LIP11_18000 [Clostridiales bacterium]|nr:hypothetical protein [Clostridiales bacterium]